MENIVIKNENGVAVTTSLKVAEKFNKKHKHVLERIKTLVAENSAASDMFDLQTYQNSKGMAYPVYVMNRDGFTFLAMSFTGKEANQFKLEYIEAFNKMEAYIKEEQGNKLPEPMTALQALAQQAQFLAQSVGKMAEIEQRQIETDRKIGTLVDKMNAIDEERRTNAEALLSEEISDEKTPDMTERKKVVMLVNRYCTATNTPQQDVWHRVYNDLYYKYGISINNYRKEKNETKLEVAERNGFIHKIYNIVSDIVRAIRS